MQAPLIGPGEEAGSRGRSGHVSGRVVSGVQTVKGPTADATRQVRSKAAEQPRRAFDSGAHGSSVPAGGPFYDGTGTGSSEGGPSSEDSFEPAPPRRRPHPINAELVKLVASVAPLELAQLKAMEQRARLKKAQAPIAGPSAAAVSDAGDADALGSSAGREVAAGVEQQAATEFTAPPPDAPPAPEALPGPGHAPPPAQQDVGRARMLAQMSAGKRSSVSAPSAAARLPRSRSGSPSRPSYLPAAPPKGASIKRDLNLLPNPVAQKQTEAAQRQAAVLAFTHRLQRELEAKRAEKERRLKAEQEALAAQLAEEDEAAKAAAAESITAEAARPPSAKRRKQPAAAAGLHGMQAVAAEPEVPKKPLDPRPWRQNMRRQPSAVSGETPAGAPTEVGPRPATDPPPPRNVSPGAAAARLRTLDPVNRSQLKEFMERKAKDTAAKLQQEKAAQLEAKTGPIKVKKAEMAKARERAQKYAEATKGNPANFKGPRPAWVDIVPPEGTAPGPSVRAAPLNRRADEPNADLVSERALPHHMSDAMRMEAAARRREERAYAAFDAPHSRLRAAESDDFADPVGSDFMDTEPQVIRIRDPEALAPAGRVYRSGTARPTRPLIAGRPVSAQPAVRLRQQDIPQSALPLPPEIMRAMDLEARLAAGKRYEQQLREMQAAERRDSSRGRDNSRGRDTSRGRDNSRGRRRSPTAGRKHLSASLNSHSRSPPKRAKQKARRSRSGSRSASANRQRPASADQYASAVQAEIQQARNERQAGNLWDLALQLHARLGALKQQGLPLYLQPPMQAWPDVQQLSLQGQTQSSPQPVAIVPTGLPLDHIPADSPSSPANVQQFDEGVQANVDFRSEVSWPTSVPKKPRTTADSAISAGVDSSAGGATAGPASLPSFDSVHYGLAAGSISSTGGAVAGLGTYASSAHGRLAATSAEVQVARSLQTSSVPSEHSEGGSEGGSDHGSLQRSKAASESEAVEDRAPDKDQTAMPDSPSKHVPAAPIIQIPMPSLSAQVAAEAVEPSPGLPYDNEAFSAESADDDGSSSGGESSYGKRVLTIAELHGMLDANPTLAQRLSLDRARDEWEDDSDSQSPPRASIVKLRPRPHPIAMETDEREEEPAAIHEPYDAADVSSSCSASSAPGTPARLCAEVVTEYERANNPLSLRPAQRELLKAQAAKRAQEQLDQEITAHPDSEESEDSAADLAVVPLPRADDPMSIINLIAHKGRVPARPAIIQLPVPALSDVQLTDQETQTIVGADAPLYARAAQAASEVLLIPDAKGPHIVISRELMQPQRPQLPATEMPEAKRLKETGVGDGRVDVTDGANSPAQLLTDSLPPYVLLPEGPRMPAIGLQGPEGISEPTADEALQPFGLQESDTFMSRFPHMAQQAEAGISGVGARSPKSMPTMTEQLESLGDRHLGGLAAVENTTTVSDGVSGIMASPPPRPRMVTFVDEVQGPPERVRLAPTELFKQMQDSIKTYEELDATEVELQQLQNARAIATIQREAHRIAQRLDQTAATESQLQLIAQTQAEVDAKLRAFKGSIRDEVRKESLEHLHDVTSMFVQELGRNKAMHATVQTTSPPSPRVVRHEIGVQVGPRVDSSMQTYLASSLREGSPPQLHPQRSALSGSPERMPRKTSLRPSSPHDWRPTSLRSTSPTQPQQASLRSASPPQVPPTSLRSASPPLVPPTSLRSASPPLVPVTSLRPDVPPTGLDGFSGRTGPSSLVMTAALDLARRRSSANGASADYSEDFEDDANASRSSLSQQPGLSASRLDYPQASHMSVPESVYEEDEYGTDEEEAERTRDGGRRSVLQQSSIPESISHYERDRQPLRAAIRQTSTISVPESVLSEHPPSRFKQQASTLSVPESVPESDDPDGDSHARSRPFTRSVAHQASSTSVAESIPLEHAAPMTTRGGATWAGQGGLQRSSATATESVAYTSFVDGDSKATLTVQESVLAPHALTRDVSEHSAASRRSRQRRSTAADTVGTSEPAYSMEFDDEEEPEEDIAEEVTGDSRASRQKHSSGSTDIVTEASEPRTHRPSQPWPGAPGGAARPASEEDEVQTEGSLSYSQDVRSESGLKSSGGTAQSQPPRRQRQHYSPPRPRSPAGASPLRTDVSPGIMSTPRSARSIHSRRDAVASPLDIRASKGGALDLDEDAMASYLADAEARMRNELELLHSRLQSAEANAAAKLAELEAQAAAETVPQRYQAIVRAQRLLEVQHDHDVAEINKQIFAIKADYARNRLMVEGVYRLANITGLVAAPQRYATTPRRDGGRVGESPPKAAVVTPTTSRRTGAGAVPNSAPILGAAIPSKAQRRSSPSSSILGDNSAKRLGSSSGGGAFSVAEELPRAQPSTTSTVAEESFSGSPAGPSGSAVASEVPEYSDEFEPPSTTQPRRQRAQAQPPRLSQQPSSVMDEIEETLSQRRLGTSGGQSQSVVEDVRHQSGSGSGRVPGSEAPRHQSRQATTTAASEDLDGGASELSVLSADLERQKAELQRVLRRKEKELREQERRAKIQAKQAAVQDLQRQVAALEKRKATLPVAKKPVGGRTAPSKQARARSSSIISEDSIPASSGKPYASGTSSVADEADEVASATPQSLAEDVPGSASSAVSESIQSEAFAHQQADGGRRQRSARQPGSYTESIAYTEPEDESAQQSSDSSKAPNQHSSGTVSAASSEADAARRLAALQKAVADKEREVRRLKQQEEEEALQRRLRELEDQEKMMKSKPLPKATTTPPSHAGTAAQRHGPSGDSTSYSEDFPASAGTGTADASGGGVHSASSIRDEAQVSGGMRAAAPGSALASGSYSVSIVDERSTQNSGLQSVPSAAGAVPKGGSSSDSYTVEEASVSRSGASKSSGAIGSGSQRPAVAGQASASLSGDVYDESFETASTREAPIAREASEIPDEPEAASDAGLEDAAAVALEPIDEEDVREASVGSEGAAAPSTVGDEVKSLSDGSSPAGSRGSLQHAASPGGGSVAEEHSGLASVSHDAEQEQEVISIADLDAPSPSRTASSTTSVRSAEVTAAEPGSPPPASEASQHDGVASVQEFLTTADINTPSAAPSIHSAELVTGQSSSLARGSIDGGQEEVASVHEFLTTAGTLGPSVAPSVHSSDLVAAQPTVVHEASHQYSSGGPPSGSHDASASSSMQDLPLAGLQDASAVSAEGDEVADLEIEYSGSAHHLTADLDLEEEPLMVQEHKAQSSSSAASSPASLGGSRDEYEVDEEDAEDLTATDRKMLTDVDDLAVAAESEDAGASASIDITDDVFAAQPSAASIQKSASAIRVEGSQTADDYELDFQPSAVEAEDVEVEPSGFEADEVDREYAAESTQEVEAEPSTVEAEELDTAHSAVEIEEVEAEPSVQYSADPVGTSGSDSRGGATGTIVQDASELMGQASLREIASASSLGASRAVAGSSRSVLPLQQQASSASAATYEDDFEESEVSEARIGTVGLAHTTLSVVEEEDDGKPQQEATGSKIYTDDFASSSAALSSAATAELRAAPAEAASATIAPSDTASTTASEAGEEDEEDVADDIMEDADIEYDEDAEEPEPGIDENQYSSVSGAPLGPMLQHSSAAPVGMEVSQRYGPSSSNTSGGYSEDFVEVEASYSLRQQSSNIPSQTSAVSAIPAEAGAASRAAALKPEASQVSASGGGPAAIQEQASTSAEAVVAANASVLTVEAEDITSATMSSEASQAGVPATVVAPTSTEELLKAEPSSPVAQEASRATTAAEPAPREASVAYSEAQGEDDYTRDFSDVHADDGGSEVGASGAVSHSPLEPAIVSHPISQAPSPTALSDNEADVAEATVKSDVSIVDEEVEHDEDLGASDLELGVQPVSGTAGSTLAVTESAATEQVELHAAGLSPGEATVADNLPAEASAREEPESEESVIIAVPPGRGLRQTRQIESRTWRNQQSLLEQDEDALEGELDLVDVTMAAEEGSGLLEMLGADHIEASEALTPSHSFRNRIGDLAGGQSSGSPFPLRPSSSSRLATLREHDGQEGEDSGASSEAVTPHARSGPSSLSPFKDTNSEGQPTEGQESGGEISSPGTFDVEEVADEALAEASSGDDDAEAPFKVQTQPPEVQREEPKEQPAASSPHMAGAATAHESERVSGSARALTGAAEPAEEPSRKDMAAEASKRSDREASGEPSAQYSDGLEAPSSNDSGGRQSVVEYDLYTSAALADDSDELAEYAAAFESQAIGVDDDEEAASGGMSGISASGMSDDLSKYKVAVQAESDEEAAPTAPAPSAAEVAAASAPPPAAAVEPSASSQSEEVDEELEIVEEEPEAAGHDPFSVDESVDRLPTLEPSAAAVAPPPLLPVAPARGASAGSAGDSVATEAGPGITHGGAGPSKGEAQPQGHELAAATVVAPGEPSSPTVSSPKSQRSGRSDLHGESSLGPVPKSGLGGAEDDDEGQGLEYRAVYTVQDTSPTHKPTDTPTSSPFGANPPHDVVAAADTEHDATVGLLDQLRAIAGSDDGLDEYESGAGMSSASLKPAFQALLDQPDSEVDVPKGDFESEIEEMLAASRSKSRLMSPYQSRDWDSDAPTPEVTTPYSVSARASLAGMSPTGAPPQPSTIIAALAAAASAAPPSPSGASAADAEAPSSPAPPSRDEVVDHITEATVKELVADAMNAMASAVGSEGASPSSMTGAPLALASPRGSATGVQLLTAPKHRLSQSASSLQREESPLDAALATPVDEEEATAPTSNLQAEEDRRRVSVGGEVSISMSGEDLEGDIELEGDLEEEPGLDPPSPLQSDSGSISSPSRQPAAQPETSKQPTLVPERSDRDLALQSSDSDSPGGAAGTSDEDLGWGGADEGAELEEGWQPDLSGYIAPEIDQATIERENAPAVATNPEAVSAYVEQVLEQYMESRLEFLVPGAEPLSLEGFLAQERRLVDASEAQHIHNKMLYDAINEALLGIYRSANRVQSQPWLRRSRIVKPLPSPKVMAEQVQQQIRSWGAQRMREPAETDKVLAADAQEDERVWADLSAEEAEVQREVAELIWAELVNDTASAVMEVEQLLSSQASQGPSSSGRRRMGAV